MDPSPPTRFSGALDCCRLFQYRFVDAGRVRGLAYDLSCAQANHGGIDADSQHAANFLAQLARGGYG